MKLLSCLVLVLASSTLFSMSLNPQGLVKFQSPVLNSVHLQVETLFTDYELGYEEKAYKWQLSALEERSTYQEQIENNLLSFQIDGSVVEPYEQGCLDCLVSHLIYDEDLLGHEELVVREKLKKISDELGKKLLGSDEIKLFKLHRYQGNFGVFSGFALVDQTSHQVSVFAAGFSE